MYGNLIPNHLQSTFTMGTSTCYLFQTLEITNIPSPALKLWPIRSKRENLKFSHMSVAGRTKLETATFGVFDFEGCLSNTLLPKAQQLYHLTSEQLPCADMVQLFTHSHRGPKRPGDPWDFSTTCDAKRPWEGYSSGLLLELKNKKEAFFTPWPMASTNVTSRKLV